MYVNNNINYIIQKYIYIWLNGNINIIYSPLVNVGHKRIEIRYCVIIV